MSKDQSKESQQEAWNYLIHQLLVQLEDEQPDWRSITSTQFSKLPCIADRYLLDRLDRDIGFPRYWYKYGEVGNREPLDSSLFIREEAEDYGGLEFRPARTEVTFDISEDTQANIDEAVDFVIENLANINADELKKFQYQHFAPNDFIREFENLRKELYQVSSKANNKSNGEFTEQDQNSLSDQLDALVKSYPAEEYDRMKEDFQDWKEIMEVLIDRREIGRAEALLEEFWSVFSKVHLRMEHNNNPISYQLDSWKYENEREIKDFEKSIESLRQELLQ